MALCEIIKGLKTISAGVQTVMRGDSTGAGVFAQAHGEWTDASVNARVMIASTGVAGVAPGTAFSATPPMAIWNPPGSGFYLSILKVALGYVSGTLGSGEVYAAQWPSQTTVPSTGTELTPVCAALGFPRGVGRAFQGSTVAGTVTLIRPVFVLPPMLATSVFQITPCYDELRGEITVPPGAVFALQATAAAGTSPLVTFGVVWEELPI